MAAWQDLVARAQRTVRAAEAAGATQAEAFAYSTRYRGTVLSGPYPATRQADEVGISVRVAVGKRLGIAGSTGHSDATIDRVIRQALRIAHASVEHPVFAGFVDDKPPTGEPPQHRVRVDEDGLAEDAEALSQGIRSAPDITYSLVNARARSWTLAVANSTGLATWDFDAREDVNIEARASGSGTDKTAQDFVSARRPLREVCDLAGMGAAAAQRARGALKTRRIDAGRYDVILDPVPAGQLVSLLAGGFRGGLAGAAASPIVKRQGERIISDLVTLRDVASSQEAGRHRRIDDEGARTRENLLIDDGVVRDLIYDSISATAASKQTTGNALRPGEMPYLAEPNVSPRCLELAPGRLAMEDLIAGAERAVLVRDYLMGRSTADVVTGEFSFIAPMAFLVENGAIVSALPPTTVAGNVYRALSEVVGIGSERKSVIDGTYSPMHIKGITCAT